MDYRVIQEFTLPGDPPTQDRLDRLRARLTAAAPGASIELGIGRMLVHMTVSATDAERAVASARDTASGVLGRRAAHAEIAP
ncbi:hypothetical protein DVA67_032900 [Solirubrobacter sp. CPCC 204708]|uniref:Uncharacterized protein n=1 Tax=Solirubrobacter deserti TaxID=2282478 RepID=A0ABT4RIR4_9ACTN|nr:hypothetical protein [Solirubrobacter deserti]MBE2320804.1 hypothetical protein [Solirubrobacter deserti]MDA0138439.1 hypothetical protein [Solirubrobacter deserti]